MCLFLQALSGDIFSATRLKLIPGIILPVLPCTVGQSLLGRGLWIFSCAFCIIETCEGSAPWAQPRVTGLMCTCLVPKALLCVAGLVCTCFGSPGLPFVYTGLVCPYLGSARSPSALKGLCALLSARVLVLHCRASGLVLFPLPILCIVGFVCSCFISLPALLLQGLSIVSF